MMTVKQGSDILGVSEQTLRLFIQNGKFGYCVKGTGDKYIYVVNENEIRSFVKGENHG